MGRDVLVVVGLAVVLAVTSLVTSALAYAVILSSDDVATGLVVRGVVLLLVVGLASAVAHRLLSRSTGARATTLAAVGAAAGLPLSPTLWVGRLALGQLVAPAGAVTVAVDALLWALAAAAGIALAARGRTSPRRPAARAAR